MRASKDEPHARGFLRGSPKAARTSNDNGEAVTQVMTGVELIRRQTEKTERIERLIASGAWTDAALALIDLELPLWQVRRIAYDEAEWYCALSRERELPDWLDRSVESRHADLALAILRALVDARRVALPGSRTSVPAVPRDVSPLYEPACCDNFG